MKAVKSIALIFAALTFTVAQPASADIILDAYVGADNHGYGDVIGSTSNFQISQAVVSLTGNILTISFATTFAGKGDDGLFSRYTVGNMGIGYGDLFLSSSWDPYGSAPYAGDNAANGTVWEYGFSLDNRWMAPGIGTGTLYSLNSGNNNADILLSQDFMTGATYRNGQEVAVDVVNGAVTALAGSSFWSVNTSTVNFTIDLTGTALANASQIAFHWGFTCANDVIEGAVSVDEPATLGLLGLGLVALGFGGRRRRIVPAV